MSNVRPGWYWRPGLSVAHYVGRGGSSACGVDMAGTLVARTAEQAKCRRCWPRRSPGPSPG